MKQVYDLIESINDKVMEYLKRTGLVPSSIAISPGSYRRLLEITAWEERIGNLIIGCRQLKEIETPFGKLSVIIDELLANTAVEVV